MAGRFRIRTSQGQEISFASAEMFAEFVRSGDLSPDDVVYDAETREWSSARTHPVVLEMLEAEEAEEAASAEAVEVAESEGADAPLGADTEELEADAPVEEDAGIGLDLAPAPAGLTPDQEAAVFVRRMESERATDLHVVEEDVPGFRMAMGPSSVIEEIATATPEPPAPPPTRRRELSRRERPQTPKSTRKTATKKKKRRSSAKYAPFAILALAAVAAGVYFGPGLVAPATGEGNDPQPETNVEPPRPPPLIPNTVEALRARANERFLTSTQATLRGLDPIPEVWLSGAYLAAPSDYPEVRATWEQYFITVQDVRAGDNARYRAAYLRALDDARIEGDARTMRLDSAVTAFGRSFGARDAHYERVAGLAVAAVQGHDALVAAEGTMLYQPATGPVVPGDPVIEAVGRGPEAQALLDEVIELIFSHLRGQGGPGEAANVRGWVWDGVLDAVTN